MNIFSYCIDLFAAIVSVSQTESNKHVETLEEEDSQFV